MQKKKKREVDNKAKKKIAIMNKINKQRIMQRKREVDNNKKRKRSIIMKKRKQTIKQKIGNRQ